MSNTPQFWQDKWAASELFEVDLAVIQDPESHVYIAFDSAPFTNGDLHVGHARNYILGDVDARYQRLKGRLVAYTTNFDVFGLPTMLAAREQDRDPQEITDRTVQRMSKDMRRLGLSYDWNLSRRTSDSRYIAYTQFFFNLLLRAGHISYQKRACAWCTSCQTILSSMQVENGCCERCETRIQVQKVPQYVLDVSNYSTELDESIDGLNEWSQRIKNIHRGYLGRRDAPGGPTFEVDDWVVSRQIAWGTPIPVINCPECGPMPVEDSDLPFQKRTGLCSKCGIEAPAESDSIDCFFDDTWCFLSPFIDINEHPAKATFKAFDVLPQLDIFHFGYDTFVYPYLYRYFSRVVAPLLGMNVREPVRRLPGHDMILRDGKKMGKRRGNSISVCDLLDTYHPDAIRLGLISAAAPGKPVQWSPDHLERGAFWVNKWKQMALRLASSRVLESADQPTAALKRNHTYALRRAEKFYGAYRPHAALAELIRIAGHDHHADTIHPERLAMIHEWIIAISCIAPHIAEDLWEAAGGLGLVAVQCWPTARQLPTQKERRPVLV